MKPIPPAKLEHLLRVAPTAGAEEDDEEEGQGGMSDLSELLTRLLLKRRSAADNKVAMALRRGEGFRWDDISVLVRHRLTTWWKRWSDGENEEEQQDEEDEGANGEKPEVEEEGDGQQEDDEAEEDGRNDGAAVGLPHHHEYTGPDFSTFGPFPPLPLPPSFTFFSLQLRQRVVFLHCLCDDHLSFSPSCAATLRSVQPRDARIHPLAVDAVGHRYFFFGFPDYRIYREDAVSPIKPRITKQQQQAIQLQQLQAAGQNGQANGEEKAEKQQQGGAEEDSGQVSSYSPGFHLLCGSPEGMRELVERMRKSPYGRDKEVSAALRLVYDDLQQGKGRVDEADGDEEEDGEEDGKRSGGAGGRKKRKRGQPGGREDVKRSMRLMQVMAEKEEQERQRKAQEEEAKETRRQIRRDFIAHLAHSYIHRTVRIQ